MAMLQSVDIREDALKSIPGIDSAKRKGNLGDAI
jgi:hypothetical protein